MSILAVCGLDPSLDCHSLKCESHSSRRQGIENDLTSTSFARSRAPKFENTKTRLIGNKGWVKSKVRLATLERWTPFGQRIEE